MDDFIDPFLQSSPWPDMHASANSYGGDEKSPSICMIPSSMENVAAEDVNLYGHNGSSSFFTDADLKYGISKGLFPGEKLLQHELHDHTSHLSQHDNDNETDDVSFSLQGVIKSNSTAGSFGPELNTSCSVTLPQNSLTMSSSIESSGSEPSAFPLSPSVPTMWPSSYSDVSFLGQGKLQGFGFQGVGSDADISRKTSIGNGKYPQMDDLPGASFHDQNELHNPHMPNFSAGQQIKLTSDFQPHQQEQSELHNLHLLFFAPGSQMTSGKMAGIQNYQQLSQPSQVNTTKHHTNNSSGNQSQSAPATASACNGAVKPRVRARRGQATDPHSIAERLRREKIAERMKNLQELVPNSNKADKASMLDEIIDYVRFLQLQVKVLSMSRLGAAGAVVPLITDAQAQASSSLLLPSSAGQRIADLSESQDNLAFEQEVVNLMESNVTTAMQYLQNKGLCLMPIALAAAISNQKGSLAAIPPDRRKPDVVISHSSLCLTDRNGGEDGPNVCDAAIKQEEALKSIGN